MSDEYPGVKRLIVHFTDPGEIDFDWPFVALEREIASIEVDGEEWVPKERIEKLADMNGYLCAEVNRLQKLVTVSQTMKDRLSVNLKSIDDITDDLLDISDELKLHQVNVKLDNGAYLNPVSSIRSKVDAIWEETQSIADIFKAWGVGE